MARKKTFSKPKKLSASYKKVADKKIILMLVVGFFLFAGLAYGAKEQLVVRKAELYNIDTATARKCQKKENACVKKCKKTTKKVAERKECRQQCYRDFDNCAAGYGGTENQQEACGEDGPLTGCNYDEESGNYWMYHCVKKRVIGYWYSDSACKHKK